MLSPSDFNNAVPQFTNGNYASNPLNPQYIAEPTAVEYNRGAEPLQTLPAQWWNWFLNRFTLRFNKLNVYVKNIFNELSQLLSLVSETPSGTEAEPTVGQLKDMFETKYPDYLKTTPALSNTYVLQTTMVNGYALSGNVTISCVACASCNGSGTAFGTASTLNTGTAAGCIPIVGTALGTTNGQFVATDASGCLKPSGCTASSFRSSSWTPSCVSCAGAVLTCAYTTAYLFDVKLTNGCTTQYQYDWVSAKCRLQFCSTTGVLYATVFCGTASCAVFAVGASTATTAGTALSACTADNASNATKACSAYALNQCMISSNFGATRSGYGWCAKCCNYGLGCGMWLCATGGPVIEAYACNKCNNTFCCYVLPPGTGCNIMGLNASGCVWIKGASDY